MAGSQKFITPDMYKLDAGIISPKYTSVLELPIDTSRLDFLAEQRKLLRVSHLRQIEVSRSIFKGKTI